MGRRSRKKPVLSFPPKYSHQAAWFRVPAEAPSNSEVFLLNAVVNQKHEAPETGGSHVATRVRWRCLHGTHAGGGAKPQLCSLFGPHQRPGLSLPEEGDPFLIPPKVLPRIAGDLAKGGTLQMIR